jgi:hypothetical protein
MKKAFVLTAVLALMPAIVAAEGFRSLDVALSSVARGFERGEAQAIVAGIPEGDQVMLQFPGLVQQSGIFGRDQAAYLLTELFQRARPVRFEQTSVRKVSKENQYHIVGNWTISRNGREESRELYITLRERDDDRWTVSSIRSAGR